MREKPRRGYKPFDFIFFALPKHGEQPLGKG